MPRTLTLTWVGDGCHYQRGAPQFYRCRRVIAAPRYRVYPSFNAQRAVPGNGNSLSCMESCREGFAAGQRICRCTRAGRVCHSHPIAPAHSTHSSPLHPTSLYLTPARTSPTHTTESEAAARKEYVLAREEEEVCIACPGISRRLMAAALHVLRHLCDIL